MFRSAGLFLVLCTFLFAVGCVRPVVFEGTSMLPAIKDGDRLLIDRNFGEIGRGDVVHFKYPKDTTKFYLKRVVGLPNETIEIHEGSVIVDGQVLTEDYVDPIYNQAKSSWPSSKIKENEFFVLGDNRDNSSDSRYWGTVNKGLIIGKYYSTYLSAQKK